MKKIHIIGASGSGTSTLAAALACELTSVHLDTDDYYWENKYDQKRAVNKRVAMLRSDLTKYPSWILSGSLCGWGDRFIPYFDLVIFLSVAKDIRLDRLQKREIQRYGNEVLPGGSKYEESQAFLNWASLYDDAGLDVRSKKLHDDWLADLLCPVLRLEGDYKVSERVKIVLDYIAATKDL